MGHKNSKNQLKAIIGKKYVCPTCEKIFPGDTLIKEINEHSLICAHDSVIIQTEPEDLFEDINKIEEDNIISYYTNPPLSPYNYKLKRPFNQKIADFRSYINSIKVSWTEGCDTLEISRETALEESMEKIEYVDLLKEVKIVFNGEDKNDAGGIMREWFMVLIKELEKKEMNLFEKSDCDEYSLIPNKFLKNNNKTLRYFSFLGKLIAKALIDNITINLCFNKIIYKMIISEKVTYDDLKFIDKQLYLSLSELKRMEPTLLQELCLYYVIEYNNEDGELVYDELIPGGTDILVKNIDDYIEKRIEYMITKYRVFINEIKKSLFNFIPLEKFRAFNSFELELLVNGKPLIDVKEWNDNTIYKGKYTAKHKVIGWFWEAMGLLSQEELRKFLQFCTGSSRVPINGFEKLESNRGEIAKFCINSIPYNSNGHNYIKAHTCFNRVDLPIYQSSKEVAEALKFVLNNEIIGFGID